MPLVFDLLRHGEAAADPTGDAHRRLTPRGEQTLRDLGERLAIERWRPDRVFASPIRRARDSAHIVTRAAGLEIAIETLIELEPEVDPATVLAALEELGATRGSLLLVGHQPQMGRVSSHLTGTASEFRPGDLVRIACDDGWAEGSGRVVLAMRAG